MINLLRRMNGAGQKTEELLRQTTDPEEADVSVLTARFRNEGRWTEREDTGKWSMELKRIRYCGMQ
jgi:hypothetical protein